MTINIIRHTPLAVCSKAIRTCWDSHHKSDNGGERDKELIHRVGNKYKHKSTLEHLKIIFEVKKPNENLLHIIQTNPYFKYLKYNDYFCVSTNVRAIQEANLDRTILQKLIPKDYTFLFQEEEK